MTTIRDSARNDLEGLERHHQYAYLVGMAKAVCDSVEHTPEVPEHVRTYAREFIAAVDFVQAQR